MVLGTMESDVKEDFVFDRNRWVKTHVLGEKECVLQ